MIELQYQMSWLLTKFICVDSRTKHTTSMFTQEQQY